MSLQNLVGLWAQHSTRANQHLAPASDAAGSLTLGAPSASPSPLAKSSKLQCSMRRLSISSGLVLQRPARSGMTVRGGANQGGATARSGGGITRRGLGGNKTQHEGGRRTARSSTPQASDRHRERRSHLDDDNNEEEGGADVVDSPLESGIALQRLQAQRTHGEGGGRTHRARGSSEAPPSFRAAARTAGVPRTQASNTARSEGSFTQDASAGACCTTTARVRNRWQSSLPAARALPAPSAKERVDTSTGPPGSIAGASTHAALTATTDASAALKDARLSLSGAQMQRAVAEAAAGDSEPGGGAAAIEAKASALTSLPPAQLAAAWNDNERWSAQLVRV